MGILDSIAASARQARGTVIFPEGDDARTLAAAVRYADEGLGTAVVSAASASAITETARQRGLDLDRVSIVVPSLDLIDPAVLSAYRAKMARKGLSAAGADREALDPLLFAALYVKSGKAGGMVAGARSDTADVLRAVIRGLGTRKGTKLISSFFLMVPPENHPVIGQPVIFADCAVNPDPGTIALQNIAADSIESFIKIFPGRPAKAAFLSFSTRGSADHPQLEKIRAAVAALQSRYVGDPLVAVEGELQFDAAVVPEIAARKSPGSKVQGDANIFIFPDLASGNIGYKIAERLGGFKAIGPLLQGSAAPASDLSRGCSADDIFYTAALTILQSR